MPIFANCNVEDIKSGFLSLVKYVATYFSVHQMAPLTLWKNIFEISNDADKYLRKNTLFLIDIALCAPQSNAPLKRFFTQLKYVKSNFRTSSSLHGLNALLCIRMMSPSLQIFHEQHTKSAINFWYNSKE